MTPSDAELQLFSDALACSGDFPAAFSELAIESGTVPRAIARAESLFHTIALIEDTHADETEERANRDLALMRVEAKLNLVLEIVGRMARRGVDPLPLSRLRWSRHGVALQQPFGTVAAEHGFLLIQPADWLPQPIELPVEVLSSEPSGDAGQQQLLLRFAPCPLSLESAIERHLFRIHRREIATARQR